MLKGLSAACVVGWLIYSWPIGLGLLILCSSVALFYSACINGPTDERIAKTFAVAVLAMSLAMLTVFGSGEREVEDAPRYCSGMQC